MNNDPKKRVCLACGRNFSIEDGEVEFYREKGLKLPRRCEPCRKRRKANPPENTPETLPERVETRFEARCDECGKKTSVPFKPKPGRGVFCHQCFYHQKMLLGPEVFAYNGRVEIDGKTLILCEEPFEGKKIGEVLPKPEPGMQLRIKAYDREVVDEEVVPIYEYMGDFTGVEMPPEMVWMYARITKKPKEEESEDE